MLEPELTGKNQNHKTSAIEHVHVLGRVAAESLLSGESILKIARSDLLDPRVIAVDMLVEKRQQVKDRHDLQEITWTPPSPKKYPDWFKWDEAFADEMYLETAEYCWEQANFYESQLEQILPLDRYELHITIEELRRRGDEYYGIAEAGMKTSFEGMDEIGFIPNSIVMTKSGVRQAGLERRYIKQEGNKSSVYTQPILEPMVVLSAYNTALQSDPSGQKSREALEKFYEPLKLHLSYFDLYMTDGDGTRMIGITHPHASGRDSDHLFDHAKNRLPGRGEKTNWLRVLRNGIHDYRHALDKTKKIIQANGDLQKMREHFWDKDVMFNCIYLENLYHMAELAELAGEDADRQHFLQIAGELEIEMQTLWEDDAWIGNGAFLNVNKDGEVIREVSVGSMVAFTLRGLTTEQLESMMNMMEKSFNTPYGIPSIPTDSPNADPHYREKGRIWRGSSWDNVNWLILRGMEMHAQREDIPIELRKRLARFAVKVEASSKDALARHWPPSEFRNPLTGNPQRKRVRPFTWAMLPLFMHSRQRLRYLLNEDELAEVV